MSSASPFSDGNERPGEWPDHGLKRRWDFTEKELPGNKGHFCAPLAHGDTWQAPLSFWRGRTVPQHHWDSDLGCPEGTPCLSNDTGPWLLKKTKKSLISFPCQRGPNLKAQWGMNDPGPELLRPGKGHCSWQAGVGRTEATPGKTEHS